MAETTTNASETTTTTPAAAEQKPKRAKRAKADPAPAQAEPTEARDHTQEEHAAPPPPDASAGPLARSKGHVCFAARGADGYEAVDDESLAVVEFSVSPDGKVLYRSPVGEAILPETGRRGNDTTCCTSAHHVKQACGRMRAEVPEATARRLAEHEASVAQQQAESGASGSAKKKGAKKMNGKSGKSVMEMWEQLFIENEKRVEAKEKPWTDAQLIEKMEREFPQSKGKSTMTRPRMYRSFYNNGTFQREAVGSAKKRGLPESHEYDSKGEVVAPGRKAGEAKPKAAPKGKAAGKGGAKRVVRKGK